MDEGARGVGGAGGDCADLESESGLTLRWVQNHLRRELIVRFTSRVFCAIHQHPF